MIINTLRICQILPSNRVNPRELQKVIENEIENAEVKTNMIRVFRRSMFNMVTIALSEINDISVIPSRCTSSLLQWIEERNREGLVVHDVCYILFNLVNDSHVYAFLFVSF